ncbi:MAG: ABC transporter ATP-binding protein [Desulfurococcaceae archaeon]
MRRKAVEILNFTKKFGDFTAVDNLVLDIYEGEIFGLLGPNGSGKTTTLLTIATVYRPTSGDIYVFGHSVTKEDYMVRKFVGIAFQEPKAMWMDKPYDILLWHARVVGYSHEEARKVVRDVMDTLGLWEHRNKYFYQLSGGTRKKVELAKVLIQRPKVAILDEPTAQVDVLSKHALWDQIKNLQKEGSTIIIATNDMFEAEKVCERIGIIHAGKLRALGTIEELKDMIPRGDVLEIHAPSPIPVDLLNELNTVYGRAKSNGSNVVFIYLERGEEKVLEIVDVFRKYGVKISKIIMKEPSLDDVFTYLTGARLREGVS